MGQLLGPAHIDFRSLTYGVVMKFFRILFVLAITSSNSVYGDTTSGTFINKVANTGHTTFTSQDLVLSARYGAVQKKSCIALVSSRKPARPTLTTVCSERSRGSAALATC